MKVIPHLPILPVFFWFNLSIDTHVLIFFLFVFTLLKCTMCLTKKRQAMMQKSCWSQFACGCCQNCWWFSACSRTFGYWRISASTTTISSSGPAMASIGRTKACNLEWGAMDRRRGREINMARIQRRSYGRGLDTVLIPVFFPMGRRTCIEGHENIFSVMRTVYFTSRSYKLRYGLHNVHLTFLWMCSNFYMHPPRLPPLFYDFDVIPVLCHAKCIYSIN